MKDYRIRIVAVAALVCVLGLCCFSTSAIAAPNGGSRPNVTILTPSPSQIVSGTVTVKVKCTDPAGVKEINVWAGKHGDDSYYRNSPPYPTSYTLTFSWDTTKEANGDSEIKVECYNVNGDSDANGIVVTVKNVKPPAVTWQAPPNPSYFKDTASSTQLKCLIKKGQGTAIRKVQIFIDNKYKTQTYYSPPKNGSSFTWTYSLNLKSLSLGKHIITVRAYNTSGGHAEAKGTIYRRH